MTVWFVLGALFLVYCYGMHLLRRAQLKRRRTDNAVKDTHDYREKHLLRTYDVLGGRTVMFEGRVYEGVERLPSGALVLREVGWLSGERKEK